MTPHVLRNVEPRTKFTLMLFQNFPLHASHTGTKLVSKQSAWKTSLRLSDNQGLLLVTWPSVHSRSAFNTCSLPTTAVSAFIVHIFHMDSVKQMQKNGCSNLSNHHSKPVLQIQGDKRKGLRESEHF